MSKKIVKIQDTLRKIGRKEPASLAVAINALPDDEQDHVLKILSGIEASSDKKKIEKTQEKEDKEKNKVEEEGRFIGRLKAKLESIHCESVVVRTRFFNCKDILLGDIPADIQDAELIQKFEVISDIDILKCLARYKQGEAVSLLRDRGETTISTAKKLNISLSFVELLMTFYKFATKFPSLCTSGYSSETLIKYKKAIEKAAEGDENFCTRLQVKLDINFEGEDDDELLNDVQGAMEATKMAS